MEIRPEVIPFLLASAAVGVAAWLVCRLLRVRRGRALAVGAVLGGVLGAYMLFFFRDPPRLVPADPTAVVAGADGVIASIEEIREDRFLNADGVRISIFLSLFDVHVNRAPISGISSFLGYFPGKHFFTFDEKSSEYNQHNAILIRNAHTRCLIKQIVGPVCRRVVYWPDHDREVELQMGDPFGMMKFGSRLDMVFPKDDIRVVAEPGTRVRAGETIVAYMRAGTEP